MKNKNNRQVTESEIKSTVESVGWDIESGIIEGMDWLEYFNGEDDGTTLKEYLEDSEVRVMSFEDAKKEVISYAKEYGDDSDNGDEVKELEKMLNEFSERNKGKTFYTYGVDTDWSVGAF